LSLVEPSPYRFNPTLTKAEFTPDSLKKDYCDSAHA
jgi:hypothetical protein